MSINVVLLLHHTVLHHLTTQIPESLLHDFSFTLAFIETSRILCIHRVANILNIPCIFILFVRIIFFVIITYYFVGWDVTWLIKPLLGVKIWMYTCGAWRQLFYFNCMFESILFISYKLMLFMYCVNMF